jgi:hypothetical protein
MSTAVGIAPTRVRTAPLVAGDSLLDCLPTSTGAISWVRRGNGLVGWGEAARLEVSGPDRFARAAEWWRQLAAGWSVEDELGLPGSRSTTTARRARCSSYRRCLSDGATTPRG